MTVPQRRARQRKAADETARLRRLDKRHLWHPFTPMAEWAAGEPVIIERGRREFIFDTEGRRYIDGVSSLWCNVHGHRRPEMDQAVRRQLGRIAHSTLLGLGSPPSILLAARLAALAPEGLTRVFYSDSGATAVEIALKMAFQYWRQCPDARPRRTKFVHLQHAYHGDTLGAVSVGGIPLFHGLYRPLLFDAIEAPAPYCYRCPLHREPASCGLACAARMEEILRTRADEVAAVILEPLVEGAAGMIVHPAGYLRRVAEACRASGVLLIADEVATGFGRTGRMFACEHEGVRPDLMCLAKGLSGGYLPLAATLATDRVYEAFLGDPAAGRTFYHGHTYTGNALACAAALASLDVFRTGRVLARIRRLAASLAALLEPVAALPHVGQVRRRGLMVGLELVADRASRAAYPAAERRGMAACAAARRRGVWVRPLGDVLVLMPPYCISQESLAALVDGVRQGIQEATGR
jgi:adenosylmethionine-8-amino-7-oxononanoate aminotransferase